MHGHSGVRGNEEADLHAKAAAGFGTWRETGQEKATISLATKARRTTRATREWGKDIEVRNRGKRVFRIPTAESRPRVRVSLGRVSKSVAATFYQLDSGHAMTAPFLKEKFRWIDSGVCWWCGGARQTREHLFKECKGWKREISMLWKEVGEASIKESAKESKQCERARGHVYKGRKGFGYGVKGGKAGPRNTTVRELLADERFTGAVVDSLMSTKVGEVKKGVVLCGGEG